MRCHSISREVNPDSISLLGKMALFQTFLGRLTKYSVLLTSEKLFALGGKKNKVQREKRQEKINVLLLTLFQRIRIQQNDAYHSST